MAAILSRLQCVKNAISKHILQIYIMSIYWGTPLMWMPQEIYDDNKST